MATDIIITATFDVDPEKIDDLRKFINIFVIIISGFVATFGYNIIPFKAYVIVAAFIGLISATILIKIIKTNE